MDKKDLIIWLYEEKDKRDYALHTEPVECGRDKLWTEVNLLDKIIAKVKKELIL